MIMLPRLEPLIYYDSDVVVINLGICVVMRMIKLKDGKRLMSNSIVCAN